MKIPFFLLLVYNTSLFEQICFDVTTQRFEANICLKSNVHVLALQESLRGNVTLQVLINTMRKGVCIMCNAQCICIPLLSLHMK